LGYQSRAGGVQARLEVSVLAGVKEDRDCSAASAQNLGNFNTLRIVEGCVRAESSKGL
jgi:hypothetical protein